MYYKFYFHCYYTVLTPNSNILSKGPLLILTFITNVNGNNTVNFLKTIIDHADLFEVECKKNHEDTASKCNRWVNKNKKRSNGIVDRYQKTIN